MIRGNTTISANRTLNDIHSGILISIIFGCLSWPRRRNVMLSDIPRQTLKHTTYYLLPIVPKLRTLTWSKWGMDYPAINHKQRAFTERQSFYTTLTTWSRIFITFASRLSGDHLQADGRTKNNVELEFWRIVRSVDSHTALGELHAVTDSTWWHFKPFSLVRHRCSEPFEPQSLNHVQQARIMLAIFLGPVTKNKWRVGEGPIPRLRCCGVST
ncbi:hypothetical protein GQ44DRAFT_288992 [Phaeosphaeriaceae sp. PMI808]|nr:hypothetical protein GQ44DRAFT_288992 [Phaeosphaeriaceae sp. PMI808]